MTIADTHHFLSDADLNHAAMTPAGAARTYTDSLRAVAELAIERYKALQYDELLGMIGRQLTMAQVIRELAGRAD